MEKVSLANGRPLLDGVFGPLTHEEDAQIRSILAAVDDQLLSLAKHFGSNHAGLGSTGLELCLLASGQLSINSYVETTDSDEHAADFLVELAPSWCAGDRSGDRVWTIEATIEVDCQHVVDHKAMETVYDRGDISAVTPKAAAQALLQAATDLVHLGMSHPVEHWTALATD
ncbi:hypothetical protein [Kribbella sp. VKM Ac-2566]|uniref:hypothetical protein n=1 Tax=Kribbella sp. VKM Ac-2566 TaxID=2512218 RepID=UPI001063D843|nr:hypothetical protein [Kribbella sp. VKM Ac-2566]TDW98631.1 hypothetical protein EV647_3356 [Kribbella sp. VKM Ac-2566]